MPKWGTPYRSRLPRLQRASVGSAGTSRTIRTATFEVRAALGTPRASTGHPFRRYYLLTNRGWRPQHSHTRFEPKKPYALVPSPEARRTDHTRLRKRQERNSAPSRALFHVASVLTRLTSHSIALSRLQSTYGRSCKRSQHTALADYNFDYRLLDYTHPPTRAVTARQSFLSRSLRPRHGRGRSPLITTSEITSIALSPQHLPHSIRTLQPPITRCTPVRPHTFIAHRCVGRLFVSIMGRAPFPLKGTAFRSAHKRGLVGFLPGMRGNFLQNAFTAI